MLQMRACAWVLFWGSICWQSAMSVNNSECQVLSKFCICFYRVMALTVAHKNCTWNYPSISSIVLTVKPICLKNLSFSLGHQHPFSSLVCFSYAPPVIWSFFLSFTSQRDMRPQISNLVFSHCKIFAIKYWYEIKVIFFNQNNPNVKCSQVLIKRWTKSNYSC